MTLEDSGKTVLLDGSWDVVVGQLHVRQHGWVQTSILKLANGVDTDAALLSDIQGSNPNG